MEKKLGFPVSMLCDRETTHPAAAQPNFISHIVLPIYVQLAHVIPVVEKFQLKQGQQNIEWWEARAEEERQNRQVDKIEVNNQHIRLRNNIQLKRHVRNTSNFY
mmetsp:Transcript_3368/g.5640  ORF Transcript_3368/g.5640 Transcript_3368/m.5640 type:complete len:104 (-) Transcript_3368:39-350(-)